MIRSCWDCRAFCTDSDRYYDTGRLQYYCEQGRTNFPKVCSNYDYEPGSDYAVRQQEKKANDAT